MFILGWCGLIFLFEFFAREDFS